MYKIQDDVYVNWLKLIKRAGIKFAESSFQQVKEKLYQFLIIECWRKITSIFLKIMTFFYNFGLFYIHWTFAQSLEKAYNSHLPC